MDLPAGKREERIEFLSQSGPSESIWVDLFRLVAAALGGAVIGFEREDQVHHAGLRTNMLVSLAACLFTLSAMNMAAYGDFAGEIVRADPIRVIEAVTAGVAFIAAGSIIRSGRMDVHGVTTAAALWLAGAVGVATGTGQYGIALATVLLALVILALLSRIPSRAFPGAQRKDARKKGGDDKKGDGD